MNKILSVAAVALILASCSNDDEKLAVDNGTATNATAIQISQKVAGVESKAAVNPGSTMDAVILMVDAGNDAGAGTSNAPYFTGFTPKTDNTLNGGNELETDAARANVANAQFAAATTASVITLTPNLYYPVSADDKKTFLFGVSPLGAVSGTSVTFTEADGLQDVMYAAQTAAGSSGTVEKSIALEFKHKTTQLTFVAKLSKEVAGTEWAGKTVSVKHITIQNAQVPEALNFSDGTVSWKGGSNLVVAGCNSGLTTSACAPSTPVMVKPTTGILVNIELSVGGVTQTYTNLLVKKDGGTENLTTLEAKSHEITFSITPPTTATSATKITTSAKVVDWTVGDKGSVEVK